MQTTIYHPQLRPIFVLCLALILFGCDKKDELPETFDEASLNSLIEKERERENAPAIAAVIVKNGQIAWQNFLWQ